ncbi:hypothetical protein WUBG_02008 [Wuchereria bancrofti]|uniref:Uncharacterized protein n=1 Tax=Wuchereria bancrofti TaxID=6293 RepID=J9FC04_WUCBA|nr:hypothetical protein WUBG_02008 [Wuchereria bancrofti]VDM20051.1 unnamed protein product [Wuchereria bancrofti]
MVTRSYQSILVVVVAVRVAVCVTTGIMSHLNHTTVVVTNVTWCKCGLMWSSERYLPSGSFVVNLTLLSVQSLFEKFVRNTLVSLGMPWCYENFGISCPIAASEKSA